MTRLAKAMSAFTHGRSGSAAGRDARSLAPRDASPCAKGSGAPATALKPRDLHYRLTLATAALLIATLALLLADAAHAAKVPIFDIGNQASGTQGRQFNTPRGVAVNHTGEGPANPGDVYVVDGANHRIQQFSADGDFIRAFGQDVIVATAGTPNSNGTGYEVCDTTTDPPNTSAQCKIGITTADTGGAMKQPTDVAVNQTTGHVYVLDRDNLRVQQFSGAGAFIRAWGRDVVRDGGIGDVPVAGPNERQEVKLTIGFGNITGGTFTLSFDPDGAGAAPAQTTGAIPYNAPATGDTTAGIDSVQEGLEGLAAIAPGDVVVTGGPGTPWIVEFTGAYAGINIDQMTGSAAGLIDDSAFFTPEVNLTTLQNGAPGVGPFEVCDTTTDPPATPAQCKVGITGTAGGMLGTHATALTGIAVDGAGRVYVSDPGNRRVMRFSATGEFERAAGWDVVETGSPNDDTTPPINEFEVCVAGEDTCKAGAAGGAGAGRFGADHPSFLAASAAGDVYAVDATNAKIVRFGSALNLADDQFAPTVVSGGGALRAIAVQGAAPAHVFFAKATATDIFEVDPTDESEEAKHPAGSSNWAGLGLNATTGRTYAASGNTGAAPQPGQVVRALEAGVPVVTTGGVTANTTGTTVTLNGTVNPNGVALNGCLFEWGTTAGTYGQPPAQCEPNAAGVGDDEAAVAVKADITGLSAGTVYNFRLKAANPTWTRFGANASFQTAGARIISTWSEDVTVGQARLKAQIDPESVATTYRFQYTTGGFEDCGTPENAACLATAPQSAGSGTAVVTVSSFLEGLAPDTAYAFRILTDSAGVANVGPERAFTTYSAPAAETSDCENQQFRTGPSALLPDCRAYEMVSPVDKNGGDVATAKEAIGLDSRLHSASAYRQASIEGGKVTYSSATAFGGALGAHYSNQYLSSRDEEAEEWTTEPISSPRGIHVFEPVCGPLCDQLRWSLTKAAQAFSPDLSSYWFRDQNVDVLTTDALQPKADGAKGYVNLYRRDSASGSYEALTKRGPGAPPAVAPFGAAESSLGADFPSGSVEFFGASDDLSVQGFAVNAALRAEIPHGTDSLARLGRVYVLVDGEARLVSVLPNGTAAATHSYPGTREDVYAPYNTKDSLEGAISADGKRIFWTAGSGGSGLAGPGTLYVRENPDKPQSAGGACGEAGEAGKACTTQIATGALFWGASQADGAHVLYSQGTSPNRTLHRYNVATKASTEIAKGVWGVTGAADDLSHVYFVSSEDRDGAGPAQGGDRNLYHYHDGAYALVAVVTNNDVSSAIQVVGGDNIESGTLVTQRPLQRRARATTDGKHLAFISNSGPLAASVAGYDNTDVVTGEPDFQVYRYDAQEGELSCVSCKPSGARPRGVLMRAAYAPDSQAFTNSPNLRVAASIPPWENSLHASRLLSDDGERLFFHSDEALLPRDTNGVQDVYQWQAEGAGQCDAGDDDYFAQNDGCVYLISTGRDSSKSEFVDADPLGDEAYISTNQDIDVRDPGLRDIYVAKVGGGFAPPSQSAECEGEACQSPPAPPEFGSPSSQTFQGPGSPVVRQAARCNRKQVRRGNRCVAKRRLAKRTCAKRSGKAKQRCVNRQMRRLNATGRAGR